MRSYPCLLTPAAMVVSIEPVDIDGNVTEQTL